MLCPENLGEVNRLGEILFEQHRWQEAIALYQIARSQNPHSASLYNYLGYAQWQKGNTEAAISSYRRAIELDPNLASTYYNLGKIWQAENNPAAAVACFLQMMKLQPDYISIYSDCGYSLMTQGKITEAMACFREAIARQPRFVESFCQGIEQRLIATKTELDEFDRAKIIACAKFLRALQKQFDAPAVREYLLETYTRWGNVVFDYGADRQAAIYYEYALQIDPDNPLVHFKLGKVREKQQLWPEAIVCYRRVLASGSFSELSKKPPFPTPSVGGIDGCDPLTKKLLPNTQSNLLPQGIYQSTQDWFKFHAQTLSFPDKLDRQEQNQCEGINCQPCSQKITQWFNPVHLGNGLYQLCFPDSSNKWGEPETFVARIPEGRVWIAPQRSDWQICDGIAVITPDNYLLSDLSRAYPGQLPGCQNYDPREHRIFQLDSLPNLEYIDGTVAILSGLSGHIYFHWLVDILPRWQLLRLSGIDLSQIDWFVVNSIQQPFQRETLQKLGIPESKIMESDRHPHLQAKELVVPSFPGFLGWLSPWALQFLRSSLTPRTNKNLFRWLPPFKGGREGDKGETGSQFLGFFGNGLDFPGKNSHNSSNYPERIYISREKARYRRIINETEVWETLKQFGFVKIFLEDYSVREQIRLFSDAKIIVAAHGSGLTNIIFCQPNTTVIELVSPSYIKHYFWVISQQLGLKHYYLAGESFACYPLRYIMDPNPLTENILVNIEGLKNALSETQKPGFSRGKIENFSE